MAAHGWSTTGYLTVARAAGRLCVRIQPNGKKLFYFRASGAAGRQSLPLGEYQQSGRGA
ncbi:DUF4102 domain-containing protein [Ottowia beijingensis]|uniref:DUF4102 domain-containing protein n=1 Tax=Ottowia beijingensis TaxID=1207057 RepID=A0A853IIP6_9BURK|nr:DUF4102 domain-containing protein [Ottowia beijingensis]NZA00593.1 DUF4102 domain-containing protein [Ottowia beijingensis]